MLPFCALVLLRENEHSKRGGSGGEGGGGERQSPCEMCVLILPYTCPPFSLSLSLSGHCNISFARRVHQTHVPSQRHSARLPSCAAAPWCAQRGKRRRAPVAVGGGRACSARVRQRPVFRGTKQGPGLTQRLVRVSSVYVCVCVCVCVCNIYTYIHTHMHTDIHAYILGRAQLNVWKESGPVGNRSMF